MTVRQVKGWISRKIGRASALIAGFLLAVLTAQPASATLLNLQLNSVPDIYSDYVSVSYNAATDSFSASGYAETYFHLVGGSFTSTSYTDGYFDIAATINSAGGFSGGTLSIRDGSLDLLTGTLTRLGYAANNPTLEFLFSVTGGSLMSDFGPTAGVILGFSGFQSNPDGFGSSFDNGGIGSADTGTPVPEPATVSLVLLGLGGLFVLRGYRSKKS